MCSKVLCTECFLQHTNNGTGLPCDSFIKEYPETSVEIVEKWAAEHMVKTRQSEFLRMFPNARLNECKSIAICPRIVDANFSECKYEGCPKCEKEYWLTEVE